MLNGQFGIFVSLDLHHVQMLSMVKNGVNQLIVRRVIIANIVILEQNNNFIRKYINRQNVMMFNRLVIVHVVYFVHLHMWNVSISIYIVIKDYHKLFFKF